MDVIIDFHSEEAIYIQLCNQIILGIATSKLREGESLPSVRQMADDIGIMKVICYLQYDRWLKISALICIR